MKVKMYTKARNVKCTSWVSILYGGIYNGEECNLNSIRIIAFTTVPVVIKGNFVKSLKDILDLAPLQSDEYLREGSSFVGI